MSKINWSVVVWYLSIAAFTVLFWMWVYRAVITPRNPFWQVAQMVVSYVGGGR